MTKAEKDSMTAEYGYGTDNMRRSKTVNSTAKNYLWDGGNIVGETDSEGNITAKYYHGSGITAADMGNGIQWYLSDSHGDVTEFNGTKYSYDAFGNQYADGEDENPFRYCGEYYDSETGFIYLRNRYYDPSDGRFISEDPVKDGLNWYVYCSSNPLAFVDPWGLFDYDDRLSPSTEYNEDVKVLQNELKYLGYYDGEVDGYYGQKTLNAVNAYKNDKGLGNTGSDWGVVGVQTWESMGLIYRTQADINAGVEIATIGLKQYFDISKPVMNAVENAKSEFESHYLDSNWFIGEVNNKGPWNLKRDGSVWANTLGISSNSYNAAVIFYGRLVVTDDIGNITYGYLGTAAGFPATVLKGASMGYHIYNHGLTNFDNELADEAYVQLGVDWYKGKDIQVRLSAK